MIFSDLVFVIFSHLKCFVSNIKLYCLTYTVPQSLIITSFVQLPLCNPHCSISLTTFIPSTTLPKTTWPPSSQSVLSRHMKNCDLKTLRMIRRQSLCYPFVFFPLFAIERIPSPVCFSSKFSS